MLGEGSKQKDGRSLVVTSGSLERKKEWLEHLKKRIFKMTLRVQNEFEAEMMMSRQSGTLFNINLTFTDDDIYIMMKCVSVCLSVTKNHHFLLGVSCNHLNHP